MIPSAFKSYRNCEVCGNNPEFLYRQEFIVPEDYPLPNEYNIVMCQKCGFIYADVKCITQHDYDNYYTKWSIYSDLTLSSGGGMSPYDKKRLKQTATSIAKYLSKNCSILDVGCATGGLLNELREQGFNNIAGLDFSEDCVQVCKERGFVAYQGSIHNPPSTLPKFDCIILSHVLEHVFDIGTFFSDLQQLLQKKRISLFRNARFTTIF